MTCNKMVFSSRAEVNAWVRSEKRRPSTQGSGGMHGGGHAYRCPRCLRWHWTSMAKSEARRRGLA